MEEGNGGISRKDSLWRDREKDCHVAQRPLEKKSACAGPYPSGVLSVEL